MCQAPFIKEVEWEKGLHSIKWGGHPFLRSNGGDIRDKHSGLH